MDEASLIKYRAALNPLQTRVEEIQRRSFSRIVGSEKHLDQTAKDSLNPERSFNQLKNIERLLGKTIANKRILEMGSGFGLSVALARLEFSSEAYGLEPASDEYEGRDRISNEIFSSLNLDRSVIKHGTGEAIPFDDNSFDVVYSNNVLEHVSDPEKCIAECIRVTKPGGYICIVVPNYGSWWEGHYGMLFLPHCPKWLFKIIVRLRGRDPSFVDSLQFITYGKMARWLSGHNNVKVLTYGQEIWEERLVTADFAEWAALRKVKRIVRLIQQLKLVRFVCFIGRQLHWETPFNVLVQKTR
jgi:SAM-dependent methyltransferase